jgi:hypothetical protein
VHIPLDDAELTTWTALEVFKRTICSHDESNEHVLYTHESEHPYNPSKNQIVGKISLPGASFLRITFDKRCRTGADTLAFYKDEEMSTEPKIFS